MSGLTTILPHLHVVSPENPVPEITLPNCSVYVVEADDHILLIDSGNGFSHVSILRALDSLSLRDGRPVTVLLTHCHMDHVGGVEYFHQSMEIAAAPGTAALLRTASHRIWYEAPELVRPLVVHSDLLPGVRNFGPHRVEIVPTPGHTGDCLSFVVDIDGRRCIFSGDLIMPDGSIGWQGSDDFSRPDLINSLGWLSEQPFDLLLTGHWYAGPEARERVRGALGVIGDRDPEAEVR